MLQTAPVSCRASKKKFPFPDCSRSEIPHLPEKGTLPFQSKRSVKTWIETRLKPDLTSLLFALATVVCSTATLAQGQLATGGWTNRYNGPGGSTDIATAIAVDNNGNAVVTGLSNNDGNDFDFATVKYSDAGVPAAGDQHSARNLSRRIEQKIVLS